jgi:hypothetical protein
MTFVPLKKLRKGDFVCPGGDEARRGVGVLYTAQEDLPLGSAAAKIGDKSLKTS